MKENQPGDAGYINLTFHVNHKGTAPFTDDAWVHPVQPEGQVRQG